jgi:hypothetical protein
VDLAALIVSAVALLISAASALVAFRQSRRAAVRRRAEQTPTFDVRVERVDQGGASSSPWYRLRLTLTSQWPLERVCVRIVNDKAGMVFSPAQTGVQGNRPLQAEGGPARPGEPVAWRVMLGSTYDEVIGLVVVCNSPAGTWELPTMVNTPPRTPRLH